MLICFPWYVRMAHRYFVQLDVGRELSTLERRWTDLISSVLQTELANLTLEGEIYQLQQREQELETLLVSA